jgi:hypothetical protein
MKATLYSEVKNNPRNPAHSLIRFQFLEIIVRIAVDKYLKTNIVDNFTDSVRLMLD